MFEWRRKLHCILVGALFLLLLPAGVAFADGGTNHRARQARPIWLGTSGGNINDRNASYCCSGTLGSLVQKAGQQYILTNNHVGARVNSAAVGESLTQPGAVDVNCAQIANDVVATLSEFVVLKFDGTNNYIDAAIAAVGTGKVDSTGRILDIGTISASTSSASVGLKVKKSGRTSGLTTGRVYATNATVNVQYQLNCGIGQVLTAKFVNQILVTPGSFLQGGDSGAVVVQNVKSNPKPVALAFAGSPFFAVASPISSVLGAFNVSFVGAGAGTTSTTSSSSGSGPSGSSGARLDAASRVRARHEDFLLTLPEAVGNGVGFSEKNPDEAVIHLYVREASQRARLAAPASLDGVRVEIVHTGDFQALGGGCARCGSSCK